MIFKVKQIGAIDAPPKSIEYHNMAFLVNENTLFSINYFLPRPNGALLLNNLRLADNSFLKHMLASMLTYESQKEDSTIFPQAGLLKCRRLITLVHKAPHLSLLPKFCLVKTSEDPLLVDNLLQVFLGILQKVSFPEMRLLYIESFNAADEMESAESSMSGIKAVNAIVKAAKAEESTLFIIFLGGMKTLQLTKSHVAFLKYCNEAFKEVRRLLFIVPAYFDKEKGNLRSFSASEIEANYQESIEVLLNINTKVMSKKLSDLEYLGKCV